MTSILENDNPIAFEDLIPIIRDYIGIKSDSWVIPRTVEYLDRFHTKDEQGFYRYRFDRYEQPIAARIGDLVVWEQARSGWCVGIENYSLNIVRLSSLIAKLPSFEAAKELANHLVKMPSFEFPYHYYKNPQKDEVSITDPWGKMKWLIGSSDTYGGSVCFDYAILPYQQIVIHAEAGLQVEGTVEDVKYHIVPFDEAVSAAEYAVAQAAQWCVDNNVEILKHDGESFIKAIARKAEKRKTPPTEIERMLIASYKMMLHLIDAKTANEEIPGDGTPNQMLATIKAYFDVQDPEWACLMGIGYSSKEEEIAAMQHIAECFKRNAEEFGNQEAE
ncbi:hypothetical protein FD723_40795 (plasmid) [Nostoc sp. C052]|uniref:hypothetical protein n=1 Tax=Nostoc sp. C052 TaxID=2576902 RepID=UPI0015C39A39|nr:hypothetical protein [Nostoc sp. C052]QLE46554.1 hypothetical protein FD723_40795 [Nostoc sp. C052]